MTSSESIVCFYCSEYAKVAKDYPKNFASNDEGSFTPRCHLHWKFECSKCGNLTHFNGIAWCSDCKTFTCLYCALYFPRPISSYLNELVRNNLVLREMSVPKVSEELVRKFPRKVYWDNERRPEFLIVKASKKSDL